MTFFYEKLQTEEIVIMQILAHFDSLFCHFQHILKILILFWVLASPKLNVDNKKAF